jgi:hypothetical protein
MTQFVTLQFVTRAFIAALVYELISSRTHGVIALLAAAILWIGFVVFDEMREKRKQQ